MKTNVKITATKGTVNNTALTDKNAIRPSFPSNGSAIAPSKAFEDVKKDSTTVPVQNLPAVITAEQPKEEVKEVVNTPVVPTAEATKMEIKEELQENKPTRNLDSTVKLVLDLNRRINQRGKLVETIDNLKAFEVNQQDDAEETDTNHFSRCVLTILDEKGREFSTKNTFIIGAVATKVYNLCVDKLAEIEGEIFIPV